MECRSFIEDVCKYAPTGILMILTGAKCQALRELRDAKITHPVVIVEKDAKTHEEQKKHTADQKDVLCVLADVFDYLATTSFGVTGLYLNVQVPYLKPKQFEVLRQMKECKVLHMILTEKYHLDLMTRLQRMASEMPKGLTLQEVYPYEKKEGVRISLEYTIKVGNGTCGWRVQEVSPEGADKHWIKWWCIAEKQECDEAEAREKRKILEHDSFVKYSDALAPIVLMSLSD